MLRNTQNLLDINTPWQYDSHNAVHLLGELGKEH
jgi:hypothetical protein